MRSFERDFRNGASSTHVYSAIKETKILVLVKLVHKITKAHHQFPIVANIVTVAVAMIMRMYHGCGKSKAESGKIPSDLTMPPTICILNI